MVGRVGISAFSFLLNLSRGLFVLFIITSSPSSVSTQKPYVTPQAPSRLNKQEYKIWFDRHGKEAVKKQTNEAIALIMSSLCSDYESIVLVVMPKIYVSERKSDVRRLMKSLHVMKEE